MGCGKGTNQHKVRNTLNVNLVSEVLMVSTRETRADAVMEIHHTRDAVEPETVELVLFHPKAQVRQEEAKDFVMAIVEETAKAQESR